jgi:hypothetical protein
MKTYSSTALIPVRCSFATGNRLATKPVYRAHTSYASALNRAAKTGDSILRRSGESSVFTVAS